ncbi:MAG TPA: hypothetical protein VKG21_01525 [Casimicrobiaceae bacterium]|nr:hypothetical protein [Casimicrobiaceae bacterium]
MDLDTLHNWLMFRPLLVFILACPFLVLPLVVSWWKDRQAAKRAQKAKADRAPVIAGVPLAVGRNESRNSPIGGICRTVLLTEPSTATQVTDTAKRTWDSAMSTRTAAGGNRFSILRSIHGL